MNRPNQDHIFPQIPDRSRTEDDLKTQYEAELEEMSEWHSDEFDDVHGCGRQTEEVPSQLHERHAREWAAFEKRHAVYLHQLKEAAANRPRPDPHRSDALDDELPF
jgi:hypothetical protein